MATQIISDKLTICFDCENGLKLIQPYCGTSQMTSEKNAGDSAAAWKK